MVIDLKLTDKFSSLSIIVLQTDYIMMSQKLSCCRYYKICCNDENIWFNVLFMRYYEHYSPCSTDTSENAVEKAA